MPRILAIDWDRLEARALVVNSGATGTTVAGAWAVPLSATAGVPPTARQIGTQLAAEMGSAVGSHATTLVGVGRDQVQMVLLSLPPAPPEELPDMVRFQAERELTSLGDDAALDFIPLSGDATAPHQVLVAALAGSGLAEVKDICQALNTEADRITLRATAAASFVARSLTAGPEDVTLVANRLSDEADLTVLVGNQPVLVRTVRLPDASDAAARQRALAGEIRRTVAAVRQQIGDRQVSRVILCGSTSEASDASALADELQLSVDVFDVMEHAPGGLDRLGMSKDHITRFAAVMGMALGEADRQPPVVDFLHVRRRAARRRFTRVHALAVAAAVVALVGFGFHLWREGASLSRELRDATALAASLENQGRQFEKPRRQAASIERWLATDVNWLDEFERLSQRWRPEPLEAPDFPAADDAVVTDFVALRPAGTEAVGGIVAVQAVGKSAAVVAPLEQRLRDAAHRVNTLTGKQDRTVPGYEWSFELRMTVDPHEDAAEVAP